MSTTCRYLILLCGLAVALSPFPAVSAENDIKLPKPSIVGKISLEAAVLAKKSVRNFTGEPLTTAQVSQVLWAANGNLPADAVGLHTKCCRPLEDYTLSRCFWSPERIPLKAFQKVFTVTILKIVCFGSLPGVTIGPCWHMLHYPRCGWHAPLPLS
jgi:hypothetical protein